jgi:anhydro-N-acetylmuramic acid kinase
MQETRSGSSSGLYIGLMSGTSTDGVDAALVSFEYDKPPRLLGLESLPIPEDLRAQLLDLNQPGANELERAALASNQLARLYAQAVRALLAQTGITPQQVQAIGAHGQTVRHAPAQGYTVQLNAPALLAEATGIAVIADFRSRDIAAGGQGAPLVPAFHQALFATDHYRTILNLGGIANITILEPDGAVRGFDTGPANVMLDAWVQGHTGQPYDHDGHWASTGRVDARLLQHLLDSEPWFQAPPPKSTGRDLFNSSWLQARLDTYFGMAGKTTPQPHDIQATLQALTATTVAQAIGRWAGQTRDVLVCGGGALNTGLMQELRRTLPCPVEPTSAAGVPVMAVEAMAFAWLAWAHENGHHAGLPAVTGARAARILGCRYPA